MDSTSTRNAVWRHGVSLSAAADAQNVEPHAALVLLCDRDSEASAKSFAWLPVRVFFNIRIAYAQVEIDSLRQRGSQRERRVAACSHAVTAQASTLADRRMHVRQIAKSEIVRET